MGMFNYIGSAMLIVIICYIIVDVLGTKKLTLKGLISRIVFIVLLFIMLLRS